MNLHTDKKLFVSAVSAAGNRFGVAEKYIEKDYWVLPILCLKVALL
jgi:hypothetical protein